MEEFRIIEHFFSPLSVAEKGAFNLMDDGAVISLNNSMQLVATTDCLIAEKHFFKSDPPNLIARKCLAVNLSDLAAMGANPKYFLLSAAWPTEIAEDWLLQFSEGLKTAQSDWGVSLIGGDTVATHGPLTINITALGEVSKNRYLTRGGAAVGDDLYVTGSIGDATLGLKIAQAKLQVKKEFCLYFKNRLQAPEPRHEIGSMLAGLATAAIDISDSLIQDLRHIVNASNVSVELMLDNIPFSKPGKALLAEGTISHDTLLMGGDDYELLFTAPTSAANKISSISKMHSVPITRIGKIIYPKLEPSVYLLNKKNSPIKLPSVAGFQHF